MVRITAEAKRQIVKAVNDIFDRYAKHNVTTILVSDIVEKLQEMSWRGLTSRNLLDAESDSYCSSFAELLKLYGYEIECKLHGAGAKYLATRPVSKEA